MSSIRDAGVTFVELLIALLLFAVLMTATAFSLNPVLLAWSSHYDRMELQRQAQHGLEQAMRDLRPAVDLQHDTSDAVRFTVREGGVQNSYILYLYHASETWPPAYAQATYQLRKATLTGGISGTFTYGGGTLLMRDVQPPPASDLSVSGSGADEVATLDVSLTRGEETWRLIEKVKRRN